MDGVIHVVATTLVDNVNVVRVVPTHRPRVNESERIAAIAETVMIVVASRPHQMVGVHSFQSCVKGNRSGRGVEWRLFWFRANFPWMIGANMSSELGVALAFVTLLHFLYRVTDQRTRSREHPTAFRAAIAPKSCGRDPDDSPRHEAMYTRRLRERKRAVDSTEYRRRQL
jgi:hypothetical protein